MVRVTNAFDELLGRRGMPKPEQTRTCEADARVDTDAVRTSLPANVVTDLGLGIRDQLMIRHADGRTATVDVTEAVFVEIYGRRTVEEALVLGNEVLIGRTVLAKLDLVVDTEHGRVIPNPAHPDHAVTRV